MAEELKTKKEWLYGEGSLWNGKVKEVTKQLKRVEVNNNGKTLWNYIMV